MSTSTVTGFERLLMNEIGELKTARAVALGTLDGFLDRAGDRGMFSVGELQDLALDIRAALNFREGEF